MDGVVANESWLTNVCTSQWEFTPWLALDYGKERTVSVEKVVLITVHPWTVSRTVQIRLSNELPTSRRKMFSGGEAMGTFKGPVTSGQIEIHSGPGWDEKTGRYLIIQTKMGNGATYLQLKEAYAVGISHNNSPLITTVAPTPWLPGKHFVTFFSVQVLVD